MQSRAGTTEVNLCPDCQSGYHAPFQRFARVAVIPDGPAFLQRSRTCGVLWQESLHDARHLTPTEAAAMFPSFAIEGAERGTQQLIQADARTARRLTPAIGGLDSTWTR